MTGRSSWLAAVLAVAAPALSAFEAALPDAAEVAMAGVRGAGSSRSGNPAGLGAMAGWFAGAGLTHPMGLSDLDLSGVWAGRGAIGRIPGFVLRWKHLGAGDLYREDRWDLDAGMGDGFWQAGAGWRAGSARFADGANEWIHGGAAGLLVRPHPRLAMGLSWEDPSLFQATDRRMVQPWLARSSLEASPADSSWVSAVSLEKRQDKGFSWAFGQELRWQVLRLRGGVRLDPWTLALGVGVRWQGVGLDWAQEGDPRIGWQQHWTISVER